MTADKMKALPLHVDVAEYGSNPRTPQPQMHPGHHHLSHEKAGGMAALDNLPSYPCAKMKLDQFFLQWLAENQDMVSTLLDDVLAGRPVRGPMPSTLGASPLSPSTAHAIFSATPPLSPSKPRSPRSPMSPMRKSFNSSTLKRTATVGLPRFYFPDGQAAQDEDRTLFLADVKPHFAREDEALGLPQKAFVDMLQETCDVPCMLGHVLFRRLAGAAGTRVTRDTLASWWLERRLPRASPARRAFEILRADGQQYLTYQDFSVMMESILSYHPGLEFLAETAEFQKKYAETVILRIFYTVNRSGSGRLSFRELSRSDLIDALHQLDREEDINKVLRYFSYEHFYVIYCKFWELDTDHDFSIDKADLAHYGQCALSYQIIDRIFEQVPRRFSSGNASKMAYEDFVWFILSEEDKTSETAIEYWFKCADIDCDGVIRPREMWFFYEEQLKRLEGLSQEPVLFEDLVCQLHDMLAPAVEGAYTLRDLKRTRMQSGLLFNALFNLQKFLSYENRDPFAMRAEAGEFGGLSDWDKFAKIEYFRLASADEQDEVHVEADELAHMG